jgi:hypothetical protein
MALKKSSTLQLEGAEKEIVQKIGGCSNRFNGNRPQLFVGFSMFELEAF